MTGVSEIASLVEDWTTEIGTVEVGDAPRSLEARHSVSRCATADPRLPNPLLAAGIPPLRTPSSWQMLRPTESGNSAGRHC